MITGEKGMDPNLAVSNLLRFKNASQKQDIMFKNPAQAQAWHVLTQMRNDAILVYPTGSGKSFLAFIASRLKPTQCTVYLAPFRPLMDDLIERCDQLKIKCCYFSPDIAPDWNGLIFVNVEHAVSDSFTMAMNVLADKGRLNMFIIDECHAFLTQNHFRESMNLIERITLKRSIRIVAMTATLMTTDVELLSEFFDRTFMLMREPADRKDIRLCIEELPDHDTKKGQGRYDSIVKRMADLLGQKVPKMKKEDRVIIYVPATDDTKIVGNALAKLGLGEFSTYHAKGEHLKREVDAWKEKRRFMIATSAFGQGVDYPSVRLVMILGYFWSPHDYIQWNGRIGRDGNGGESITLSTKFFVGVMNRYAMNQTISYVQTNLNQVASFLDSNNVKLPKCLRQRSLCKFDFATACCIMDIDCIHCSVCEEALRRGGLERVSFSLMPRPRILPINRPVEMSVIEGRSAIEPAPSSRLDEVLQQRNSARLNNYFQQPNPARGNINHQSTIPAHQASVRLQDIPLPTVRNRVVENRAIPVANRVIPVANQSRGPSQPDVQTQSSSSSQLTPPNTPFEDHSLVSLHFNELGFDCMICLVMKGTHCQHPTNRCPLLLNTCIRCLHPEHTLGNCPDRSASIRGSSSNRGICWRCASPWSLDEFLKNPESPRYDLAEKKSHLSCDRNNGLHFVIFGLYLYRLGAAMRPKLAEVMCLLQGSEHFQTWDSFHRHLVTWLPHRDCSRGEYLWLAWFEDESFQAVTHHIGRTL